MELYKLSISALIILLAIAYASQAVLNANCNTLCIHNLKANQNGGITAKLFYKNKLLLSGFVDVILNNKYQYNGNTNQSGYINAFAPLSIGINRLRLSYEGSFLYFYIVYFGEFSNYIPLICCIFAFVSIVDVAKRMSERRCIVFYLHSESGNNLAQKAKIISQLINDEVSKVEGLKINPKILCEYRQIKDVICRNKKFVIDEFSIKHKMKNFNIMHFNSNVFLCKKAPLQMPALSAAYENAINSGSMRILKDMDEFIRINNIVIEKNCTIEIKNYANLEKTKIKIVISMSRREMANKLIRDCAGIRLLFLCKSAEVIR